MKRKLSIELGNLSIRYAQTIAARKRLETEEAAQERRIAELIAAIDAVESVAVADEPSQDEG